MTSVSKRIVGLLGIAAALCAQAQMRALPEMKAFPEAGPTQWAGLYRYEPVDTVPADSVYDEIEFDDWGFPLMETYYRTMPVPSYGTPMVFDTYQFLDTLPLHPRTHGDYLPEPERIYSWIDELDFSNHLLHQTQQRMAMDSPEAVRYLQSELPEPPKHYRAVVDPETTTIVLTEVKSPQVTASQAEGLVTDIERKIWINSFNASLQFSQAYISPNWYQGGKNNLNMLASVFYNIKLNQRFYPKLMFETTAQYKLGLNNAPDDSLRAYSISEDLLQITSKFGLKAASRWYYSVTLAFKTQILSSYKANTHDLKSAFLSPGELNVGLGMTYNYTNKPKTFTTDASISPLSWNMKSCINSKIDETAFGIDQGHRTVNQYGSSAECNATWKITYNITYRSRLFAFTDYSYFQGDWEHTLSFAINRYLSTQIYAHMRYDSSTERRDDTSWHKFQFKEIFSFGLSYSI